MSCLCTIFDNFHRSWQPFIVNHIRIKFAFLKIHSTLFVTILLVWVLFFNLPVELPFMTNFRNCYFLKKLFITPKNSTLEQTFVQFDLHFTVMHTTISKSKTRSVKLFSTRVQYILVLKVHIIYREPTYVALISSPSCIFQF